MSYSDEWFRNLQHKRGIAQWPKVEPTVESAPVESTTWKPWSEMTATEKRKALENREEKTDATRSKDQR